MSGARSPRLARAVVALVAALVVSLGACRKKPPTETAAELTTEPMLDPPPPAPDAGPQPRCGATTESAGPIAGIEAAELGAIGGQGERILRVGAAGRSGREPHAYAVALTSAGVLSTLDLGVRLGDAPPPAVALDGTAAFAAFHVPSPSGGGGRRLQVVRHTTRGRVLATFLESNDDSFAVALLRVDGGVLVAWDDVRSGTSSGAIAVTFVADSETATDAGAAADGGGVAVRSDAVFVSPRASDAEEPLLYPRPGGAWLVYAAARSEEPEAGAPLVETPGEARQARWLEALALDPRGRPEGPPRTLTSTRGHVAETEALVVDGVLHLLARDETETREGGGGRIQHVAVRASGAERPRVVVDGDVGRGRVSLLRSPEGLMALAFMDTSDHLRLVPLAADFSPQGPPSVEPGAEGLEPLVLDAAKKEPRVPGAVELLGWKAGKTGGGTLERLRCRF